MRINVNEFRDVAEALRAQAEFPYCGECRAGNKLQQIDGRTFLLCLARPRIHQGIGDWGVRTAADAV